MQKYCKDSTQKNTGQCKDSRSKLISSLGFSHMISRNDFLSKSSKIIGYNPHEHGWKKIYCVYDKKASSKKTWMNKLSPLAHLRLYKLCACHIYLLDFHRGKRSNHHSGCYTFLHNFLLLHWCMFRMTLFENSSFFSAC